jgi:hypothetical protein
MDKKSTILILVVLVAVILVSGCAGKKATNPNIQNNETPQPNITQQAAFSEFQKEARENLSHVKVASHYRYITDGMRSVDDAINIFKETKTDFIVLGWARINLIPDKCSDLAQAEQQACNTKGYSYEYLRNAAAKLKSAMPNVILGGGLSAEFLNPESINEMTGEKLTKDQTWAMALDPQKWGIPMSKEEFQTRVAISHGWTQQGQTYNPKEQMLYYFPDQTNPEYQNLFLSWAEKQIDSGADQILIDINTKQAKLMEGATGDVNHPAVKDAFKGTSEIVNKIHQYGYSKGKYVYVMSWATVTDLESPYPAQDLDAVITTPSTDEIKALKMDEAKWDSYIASIRKKFGNIPIFVMFDQGPDYRPLEAFSQELTGSQQQQFLKIADDFFTKKGLIFIYPVHGGMMGADARVKLRSYGKYNWYDSLAPEFDTYNMIKELATKK